MRSSSTQGLIGLKEGCSDSQFIVPCLSDTLYSIPNGNIPHELQNVYKYILAICTTNIPGQAIVSPLFILPPQQI